VKECKWIHTLNLSGNKITDEGAQSIGYYIDLLKDDLKPNTIFLCMLIIITNR